ncbi:MAG: hypothetical protein CMH83_16875 [Nocardioides sp.]|nr:hypothetical protein [Nocardioides sp.]
MVASTGAGPRRVVLHVGTPKSGTTFLQQALWNNRDELAERGVRLPGSRQRDMFIGAVEVREQYRFWGYPAEQIDGTWASLCRDAKQHDGLTIMSHELLGGADPEQARRALAELDGVRVDVVLTVRDLVRQATSEWQERVKNGSSRRFTRFQRRVVRQIDRGNFSSGFWLNQDPVGALDRWATGLDPARVHVVVAPPSGSDPGALWQSFGEAIGVDTSTLDPAVERSNQALGEAQVAVLRRVNKALDGRIEHPMYARVVKNYFAENLLAQQSGARPQCPPRLATRLRRVAQQHVEVIRDRGYQVHGDLAHLVPEVDREAPSPDKVSDDAVVQAFADVVAELLVKQAGNRREAARVAAEVGPEGSRPLRWLKARLGR